MFNSLKYAKILQEAGFTQREAETTVNVLIEVMENKLATQEDLKELRQATQDDLRELRQATQDDFKELEIKLSDRIKNLEHQVAQIEPKLTIKLGAMLAASIAIMTAMAKLV